jgi:hypothetical protein
MKTLYSLLSHLASMVLAYTFVSNLKYSSEFSYLLIMSMVAILFFIFIILSVLSFPKRTKTKSLFYNSYSDKRTKNDDFDKYYSFMNE